MNNKLISAIGTAILMVLTVVILLAFGYDPPDPPIPEEGVEVNLGNSEWGSGDSPEQSSPAVPTQAPATPNRIATQNVESTPNLGENKVDGTTTKPVEEPKKVEPQEPKINTNALFTGRRNQQNGDGSQGVSGGSGDQGKPNGTVSSNNYDGNGGGNGMNFKLNGRSSVSLPKPVYNTNDQGTVVIRIWVDRDGKVTRAEFEPKGSNTQNGYLVNQARTAALRARFNADDAAPDEQRGTITYIFKI